MRQARNCVSVAKGLMVLTMVTALTSGMAFGQAKAMAKFQIPYEFVVGSSTLPAGAYTFAIQGVRLVVNSPSGSKIQQNIMTELSGPSELFRRGSLVFEKSDKGLLLSEVWMPGENGLLLRAIPKDSKRELLWESGLSSTQTVSGKTAFSLTCAKCHGADGKGDKGADKFFNTTIPRLNSAAVQALSDETLRTLIMKGSDIMPPVEIDEAGYRHRLPPQDLEAVIAYVRTLKQ